MSIHSDIRMEALAATRDRPVNPNRPVITFNEEGKLTTFTGKACGREGCGVQLTSANRYGTSLLCLEHGREHDRARGPRSAEQITAAKARRVAQEEGQNPARSARTESTRTRTPRAAAPVDPKKEHLQTLFRGWMSRPDMEAFRVELFAAMTHFELSERLSRLLPPLPQLQGLQGLPVEDPGDALTNPDHRSTRSEFLADADYYGA